MHDRTKRVAVVTSRFPFPLERGDKLRAYHQIRSLSAHMRIALIAIVESEIQESWIEELSPYCESIDLVHKPKLASVPSLALASLRGEPMQVGYFKTRRVRREVAELVAARDPDFLYCQLIRTAFAADDSKGRTTIDFQDSMSAATHRRSKLARFGVQQLLELESKRLAKYERKAYAWFDNQVIISEQDRDTFEFPEAKGIDVLGNGVDTKFFCPRPGVKKGFDVGFIGNLGYPPNVAAVDLLVREVMPRIQSERGDATCLLAGARPVRSVLNLSAGDNEGVVEVKGWVDDIRDAYAETRVVVAPLFMGAGQQNKILESMAMGVPVVTTDLVNNAIGAQAGTEILLANTAQEFASATQRLLCDEDLYREISERGREFVVKNFAWERVGEKLADVLEQQG